VVIGAGVVGAALASALVTRGVTEAKRIALIDVRLTSPGLAETGFDLRVVALNRASQRFLEVAGAWHRVPRDRRCPYERMRVWDASGAPDGAGSIGFDAADLGEPDLGSIVEARALQRACLDAASAAGVIPIEARLERLELVANGMLVTLADGRELKAALVLGADGVESRARQLLGIETAGHVYHQDALVAHVRTARPHQSTAWQRFLPGGPLAFLPLPDGRSSIVWSLPKSEAVRLRALDRPVFDAELTAASDGVLGEVESTTPLASFALRLQHAERYVGARAVLLGDAAHVVHPLAGQGLNLGLLDGATLIECLSEARGPLSALDAAVLRRYERWRRSENQLAAAAFDALERLFASRNVLIERLRALGLQGVGRVAPLRNHLARRALGLVGDLPELLRRERSTPGAERGAFVRAGRSWPRR